MERLNYRCWYKAVIIHSYQLVNRWFVSYNGISVSIVEAWQENVLTDLLKPG